MENTKRIVGNNLTDLQTSAEIVDTVLSGSKSKPNSSELPRPSSNTDCQSKGQQLLIKLWDAATTCKSSTPPSQTCSPARVRRIEDRSPDELGQLFKREKNKKQKKCRPLTLAYTLKICSLNTRGLRDHKKRNNLFFWIKQKQFDVIFLQETYWTDSLTYKIQKE